MKILFSMLSPAYVRNVESVLRLLAERGHTVAVLFHEPSGMTGAEQLAHRLTAEYATIALHWAPDPRSDAWAALAREVRAGSDYVRFLDPRYNAQYVNRAESRVPSVVREICNLPPLKTMVGRNTLAATLRLVERAIPSSTEIETFIANFEPDIVLFTPLIGLRTSQPEYLKSAQSLGLRTVCLVASWDNLSSKSVIRPIPEAVAVWNEAQKAEAVALHGVPPDRVIVTGAPTFDQWFEWRPRPRHEFCRRVGIPPETPYVLYVCSALFTGGPREGRFVEQWIRHVWSSRLPALRELGILVRPHPKRAEEWHDVDLSGLANVALWPKEGGSPSDDESKADYYDSIYHSAAVVGLNTSALIEAGIVGRPVHSVLMTEYRESQEGTLHFHYLMDIAGGLLKVARTLDEHLIQLAATVSAGVDCAERNHRFLEAFVRPRGLSVPATTVFVESVEMLAKGAVRQGRWQVPVALRPLSSLLYLAGLILKLAHRRRRNLNKKTRNLRKKTKKAPLPARVSQSLREGRDFGRICYAGTRRLLALPALVGRQRLARRCAASADFDVPRAQGYRLFPAGRFPEADEIVKAARAIAHGIEVQQRMRKSEKTFMVALLDQSQVTLDSSFIRFALRPDVVAAVADYLGVVPVLGHIDVYYSSSVDGRMISSKLFHCDGDDTSQIKVFVLCSQVGPDNGPTVVMDAETSKLVRRKVRYAFRARVTDEQVFAAVGRRDFQPVMGPPGTVCFVDTSRCFHYGSRMKDNAVPRLVTVIQFLTPFSFMLPRDHRRGAPYRHLATPFSTDLERAVLGAI